MSGFAVISLVFNFLIGIALLVYYFSNFREINSFIKYGLFVLAIYITVMALGGGIDISSITMQIVSLIKIAIYTCIGMYLSSKLGYKDMPLLRKVFRSENDEKICLKDYALSTIAVTIGATAFSYVLFKLTQPGVSDTIKKNIDNVNAAINVENALSIDIVLLFIGIVITEELIFRFVIPNYLAVQLKLGEKKYWIAIAISSMLWALAHASTLDPEWIKFIQIFPIGLALGVMYKRYGLESCIIAHTGFNILMMLIGSGLVV